MPAATASSLSQRRRGPSQRHFPPMKSSTTASGFSAQCRVGWPTGFRKPAAVGACRTRRSWSRGVRRVRWRPQFGEGKMYTRNAGNQRIFSRGPSIGFDAGADGDRTMMPVCNLPDTGAIFDRFGGLDGSAYFIGGLGFTAVGAKGVVVVPIRTGLGWRLGVNLNDLKFTQRATWNPFLSPATPGCSRRNPVPPPARLKDRAKRSVRNSQR